MGKRKQRDPPSFMTAQPHKGFVPMFNDQLNSPAFISLSTVAKVMYLILRQEYKGDYTGNNIICPCNRCSELRISRCRSGFMRNNGCIPNKSASFHMRVICSNASKYASKAFVQK